MKSRSGHGMKGLSAKDPRVAYPLFTLREAASYLDVPSSTLTHWANRKRRVPLITTFGMQGTRATVPFVGFAEAFVIKTALSSGVPRNRIRPGIEAVKEHFEGVDYALAHELVYADGAEILYREVEEAADADLTVARLSQTQFTDMVRNQLKQIQYAGDGFASQVRLPRFKAPVIVDPVVAAGSPLMVHGGARMRDLRDRYAAGDTLDAIAKDFDVPIKEVREVVRAA